MQHSEIASIPDQKPYSPKWHQQQETDTEYSSIFLPIPRRSPSLSLTHLQVLHPPLPHHFLRLPPSTISSPTLPFSEVQESFTRTHPSALIVLTPSMITKDLSIFASPSPSLLTICTSLPLTFTSISTLRQLTTIQAAHPPPVPQNKSSGTTNLLPHSSAQKPNQHPHNHNSTSPSPPPQTPTPPFSAKSWVTVSEIWAWEVRGALPGSYRVMLGW